MFCPTVPMLPPALSVTVGAVMAPADLVIASAAERPTDTEAVRFEPSAMSLPPPVAVNEIVPADRVPVVLRFPAAVINRFEAALESPTLNALASLINAAPPDERVRLAALVNRLLVVLAMSPAAVRLRAFAPSVYPPRFVMSPAEISVIVPVVVELPPNMIDPPACVLNCRLAALEALSVSPSASLTNTDPPLVTVSALVLVWMFCPTEPIVPVPVEVSLIAGEVSTPAVRVMASAVLRLKEVEAVTLELSVISLPEPVTVRVVTGAVSVEPTTVVKVPPAVKAKVPAADEFPSASPFVSTTNTLPVVALAVRVVAVVFSSAPSAPMLSPASRLSVGAVTKKPPTLVRLPPAVKLTVPVAVRLPFIAMDPVPPAVSVRLPTVDPFSANPSVSLKNAAPVVPAVRLFTDVSIGVPTAPIAPEPVEIASESAEMTAVPPVRRMVPLPVPAMVTDVVAEMFPSTRTPALVPVPCNVTLPVLAVIVPAVKILLLAPELKNTEVPVAFTAPVSAPVRLTLTAEPGLFKLMLPADVRPDELMAAAPLPTMLSVPPAFELEIVIMPPFPVVEAAVMLPDTELPLIDPKVKLPPTAALY